MSGFNNMNQMEAPDYSVDFLGTVVFNKDPDKRQRVKVTIKGLLEGDPDLLPWISPTLQSTFGMDDDSGVMQVPVIGSLVKLYFQGGDVHYGIGAGYLHTAKHTMDPDLLVNYPMRRGWKDPKGNKFWIDMTDGELTTHFETKIGTKFTINNEGRLTGIIKEDCDLDVTGTVNINVKGDTNVTTDGDTKIVTKGKTDINSTGNTNITGEMINLNNS